MSAAQGLVASGLNGKNLIAVTAVKSGQTVLNKTNRIGVDNRGETTVYKMYDFRYMFEEKYRECAHCTVATLQDAIEPVYKI